MFLAMDALIKVKNDEDYGRYALFLTIGIPTFENDSCELVSYNFQS